MAKELACDWHTVNDAVTTYGTALLEADRKRLNQTTAIGLDETSFVRLGSKRQTDYATTVADVENHQIIDILRTRRFTDVAGWIDKQPRAWKERIRYGALDMSATYAAVYSVMLPTASQVVDPFHVISLANRCLDAVRRRVQFDQLGHRGRRDDPLYRARRVLLMGEEKLDAEATERLHSLLALGDPNAEVAIAYRIKEPARYWRPATPHIVLTSPAVQLALYNQLAGELPSATFVDPSGQRSDRQNAAAHANQPIWTPGGRPALPI